MAARFASTSTFHGHGGYAIARRGLPIDLPANFEFAFSMRAQGPRNTLEFKLIDPTGENVWWMTKREFDFPPRLETHRGP